MHRTLRLVVVCAALMGCDSVLDLGDSNDAGGSGGGTGSLRFDVPVVLATKGNAQCGDLTGLGPQSAGKAFYPLLATRLTPDFYPVQVNQVRYVLQAPPGETVLKAHRAWLYVSRFPAGPADSTPITRWDVPETTVAAGDVATFSLDIRTVAPPLLHDGESILVVVDTSPLGPQGPVNRLSLCHRSEALTETRFFFAGDGWGGWQPAGLGSIYWQPDVIAYGLRPADASPRDAGTPADPVDAGSRVFSNITDPTGAVSYVLALPSEVGMWQATRLGPAASPTTITTIAYPEVVGGPCDPSFAHRVRVFKSASATPPAEPVVEDEVAVAGRSAPPAPALQVVVPLHRPLVLGTGEYLFVSVEMNGAGVSKPLGLCLAVNKNGTQHGLDFWSYAATAPFAWKDLKDDGIAGNVAIEAFGP